MKILVVGRFDASYNRTHIILSGLNKLGVEVETYAFKKQREINRVQLKSLLSWADIVFMPSFTHRDVPYIRRMSEKPIVFDPLISRYLSQVFDYQKVSRYSLKALRHYIKDYRALRAADFVVADTEQHRRYYLDHYHIRPEKVAVLPVGVTIDEFKPTPAKASGSTPLQVGFYGSFIPLHGIDVILQAAALLKDVFPVHFTLIGDGTLKPEMQQQAKASGLSNVTFKGWVDYAALDQEIAKFDIALGIFGESLKASLVVPNKNYHYAACGKAIITMKSKAASEVFTDAKDALLVENNAQDLADAILRLKSESLRMLLATNARQLMEEKYSDVAIARKLLQLMVNNGLADAALLPAGES